jgi:hypothetical protein
MRSHDARCRPHSLRLAGTQSTSPRRTKKWLRQPFVRQTDGISDTVPSACSSARQRGRLSANKLNWTASPQPQGQRNAADHNYSPSPIRYSVPAARRSGISTSCSVRSGVGRRRSQFQSLRKSSMIVRITAPITRVAPRAGQRHLGQRAWQVPSSLRHPVPGRTALVPVTTSNVRTCRWARACSHARGLEIR